MKQMLILLQRMALLLLLFFSLPATGFAQNVEIEVGDPGGEDDYICWSPAPARIRLRDTLPAAVEVALRSTYTGGAVVFNPKPAHLAVSEKTRTMSMSAKDFASPAPTKELRLKLPGDRSWVYFFMSGASASSKDKDVAVLVYNTSGGLIAKYPLMVRVRKDAENLSAGERDRFLRALATLKATPNAWDKFWRMHEQAGGGPPGAWAHGVPIFLAWHRIMLLHLERELQAIDPSVALPYWVFDANAPKLFATNFLGRVDPVAIDSTIVQFDILNPLFGWRIDTPGFALPTASPPVAAGPLRRQRNGDVNPASFPGSTLQRGFMGASLYGDMRGFLENSYHGSAHTFIGGWLRNFLHSPGDPLFFLLHANVDRAWAIWQRYWGRFDPAAVSSYQPQGTYPGPAVAGRWPKGNYLSDTMWPWDGVTGPASPGDTLDDRPANSFPRPMMARGPGLGPGHAVRGTVDYLDTLGETNMHAACYHDVPYGKGPVGFFWTPP
jgi:tyrosinase